VQQNQDKPENAAAKRKGKVMREEKKDVEKRKFSETLTQRRVTPGEIINRK